MRLPQEWGRAANLSYTFDQMGRLNGMTDNIASQTMVSSVAYGPANEITQIYGGSYSGAYPGEIRTYNSLKQLTGISTAGINSVSYAYPLTGNNGKIASQTDGISGETVTYTYDALNRLATAENSGASPSWGQGFTYDGFGNLTNTSVIQGSAPTMTASYDVNNHAGGEDANGNPSSVPMPAVGSSGAGSYDVENRLVAIGYPLNPAMYYSYDPMNHRVWRGESGGIPDEVTFWSISGRKLSTYQITQSGSSFYCTQTGIDYYFGEKLIEADNAARSGWVYSDRLGSIGKFYPYGIERPSATANGTEKFTGYMRDSETGNDYAVNRYESPGTGRFLTTDPLASSAKADDPGSWNRYAYVQGDPTNQVDPNGADLLCVADPGDPDCNGSIADYCENLLQAAQQGDPVAITLFGTYCPNFVNGGGGGGGAGGPPANSFAPNPTAPTISGAGVPSTLQAIFNAAFGLAINALANPACDSVYSTTLDSLPLTSAQLWATLENASYV